MHSLSDMILLGATTGTALAVFLQCWTARELSGAKVIPFAISAVVLAMTVGMVVFPHG